MQKSELQELKRLLKKAIDEGVVEVDKEEEKMPKDGEGYYHVSSTGSVESFTFRTDDTDDLSTLSFGNVFWSGKYKNPKEAAQMHALRIESLKDGVIPNENELWYWSFLWREPDRRDLDLGMPIKMNDHYPTISWFRSKEACQAWGDMYAKAWIYFNNPENYV